MRLSWMPISSRQMLNASSSFSYTDGYSRSGSRPTQSGLVRNSHDQAMASCLK